MKTLKDKLQKHTYILALLATALAGCDGQEAKAPEETVATPKVAESKPAPPPVAPAAPSPAPAALTPTPKPAQPAPPPAPYHATLEEGIDFSRDSLPDFLAGLSGLNRAGRKEGMWFHSSSKSITIAFKNALPKKFKIILNGTINSDYFGLPFKITYGTDNKKLLLNGEFDIKRGKMELENVTTAVSSKTEDKVITITPEKPINQINPGYLLLIYSIKIIP